MSDSEDVLDVFILGGGPAGLSALLWCNDLGMSAVLIDQNSTAGGQLHWIHNPIKNYLGRESENGGDMADHFVVQLATLSEKMKLSSKVTSFDAGGISASLANGEEINAQAAIIATGVRRRRLNVPGEIEFAGHGILDSGARQKFDVAGKRVAIIGGGDAAIENALMMSEFAEKVYVIHRRDKLSAREEFAKKALATSKIECLFDTTVQSINGRERLESLTIFSKDSEPSEFKIDFLLIRIGVEPNTELFTGQIDLDDRGYVVVDARGKTRARNVFAVGDVANPLSPTISTAVGTAATAAKAIYSFIYSPVGL
jgi:thioredoxin reductase (NADPH)